MSMQENDESGTRFRFHPVQRDSVPNRYPDTDQLIYWCAVFDREGMAPLEGGASAGNLSFRTASGFVITPTRGRMKGGLRWNNLVEVVRSNWSDYAVHFLGAGPPSSDSFLHEKIYVERPDVTAVFHGHDETVLRFGERLAGEMGLVFTPREIPFGTREDAEETAFALGQNRYIIRKGHGFVSVGASMDEAGEFALQVHKRAVEMAKFPDSA